MIKRVGSSWPAVIRLVSSGLLLLLVTPAAKGTLQRFNDPKHGGLLWNSSRPTGYGAVPGYRPPPLGHGRSLVESSAWGGKWMSIVCGYHIGLRTLWSDSAQWASADPAGHGGSENLMSFAGGDPINLTDVDGRCNAAFNAVHDAILNDALDSHRPLNEFLGNARYLGGDGGALDRLSSSFLNSGGYGLPSDYAHHYVENPVTPLDGLTVRNFSGGWDDLSHREQFSRFLDYVPGVGTLKGAAETVFGEDFISGKEASRWQGAAMVGLSLVPLGGQSRLGLNSTRAGSILLDEAAFGMSSSKNALLGKTSLKFDYVSTGNSLLDSFGIRSTRLRSSSMWVDPALTGKDFLETSAHEAFHMKVAQKFPNFSAAGGIDQNRSVFFEYLSGIPAYFEEVGAYGFGMLRAGRYGSALFAPVEAFGSLSTRQNVTVLGVGGATAASAYLYSH